MSLVDKIDEHITSMMLGLTNLTHESNRKFEFRVSGLPFCPLYQFMSNSGSASYTMEHYANIGTAMHETLQQWISLNPKVRKRIWGNWKCTGCGTVKKFQFYPKSECDCSVKFSTIDKQLRGRPKFWTYEEITVKWKNLSGHVDLIYFLNNSSAIVLDFKTTALTEKKTSWYWDENRPGSPSNVAQIRSYATLLPITHDLPIVGWGLINVDRTKPVEDESSFSNIISEWGPNKQARWLKFLEKSSYNYELFKKLNKAVDKGETKPARRHLKECISNRPCTDKRSYSMYMDYKFFGQEICPYKRSCLAGNKRVLNHILHDLEEKE